MQVSHYDLVFLVQSWSIQNYLGELLAKTMFNFSQYYDFIAPRQDRTSTGKYFSEALILASTNPKYDDRLFIKLRDQYITIASSEHAQNILCT